MEDRNGGHQSSEEESFQESFEAQGDELPSSVGQPYAIGRRLPGCLIPTVEAVIIARKIKDDGTIDVSLLLAPYMKKGSWIKAAVHVRNSQKLAKRVVDKYTYPLPWAAKLALEAVRYRADAEWVKNTLDDINSYCRDGTKSSLVVEPDVVDDEKEEKGKSKLVRKGKVSSSDESDFSYKRADLSVSRVLRSTSVPKRSSSSSIDIVHRRKHRDHTKKAKKKKRGIWPNSPRAKRAAAKAVRSSSSESSQDGNYEVGDSDWEDDGLVDCPFTSKDIRRFVNVKKVLKGKAVERRFIRQALHNLYRHYTSLQTFVDALRSRLVQGVNQPYPSELVWLEHHAIYIDCLLLESLHGMWGLWQEPILDLLVMSFLELTVRCSPRRQYPDKLEERVRKWMKKNRVGLSLSYGPLPFFLQNAKVSDRGVLINSNTYGRGRQAPVFGRQSDGRGRGSTTYFSGFNRRGGFKPETKTGSHE